MKLLHLGTLPGALPDLEILSASCPGSVKPRLRLEAPELSGAGPGDRRLEDPNPLPSKTERRKSKIPQLVTGQYETCQLPTLEHNAAIQKNRSLNAAFSSSSRCI